MELAEAAVHAGPVDRLDIRHDRRIARPREDVGHVSIGAEHRDDAIAQDRAKLERALVRGARHEARTHSGRIEDLGDRLRRIHGPRRRAVVQVRVEQGHEARRR